MAVNGQQYATWWTYVREDGEIVTVEGCYFLPRQCGGEAQAMAAALTNLTAREEKGRGTRSQKSEKYNYRVTI